MDLQLTCVDPLWHPERVWSWSKQILKLLAWEKKKPTFPDAPTGFPPPHPLQNDIPGTSPEIPDQTSALVLVENLLHPSIFFTTFRQFVWLAFVHARSSPSTSTSLVTTLESRASPGTSPETGRASASHWRLLWEGRPTSEVQGACWPWRR